MSAAAAATAYPTHLLWSCIIQPWLQTVLQTLPEEDPITEPPKEKTNKALCPFQCYQTTTGCLKPWRNTSYQHGRRAFLLHHIRTLQQLGPLWPTEGPLYERLIYVLYFHLVYFIEKHRYHVPVELARSACNRCFRICHQNTVCPFCQGPKNLVLPPCYPRELYVSVQRWFDSWRRLLSFLDADLIQTLRLSFECVPSSTLDQYNSMVSDISHSETFNMQAYSTERLAKVQTTHKLWVLWNIQTDTSLRQVAECCYRAWEQPPYTHLPTGQYYSAYQKGIRSQCPLLPQDLLSYVWTFVFGDAIHQVQCLLENVISLWTDTRPLHTTVDRKTDLMQLVDCFGILSEPDAYLRLCAFSTSTLNPVPWVTTTRNMHIVVHKPLYRYKTAHFSVLIETQSVLQRFCVVYVLRQGYFTEYTNTFYDTLLDLLLHINHEHWSWVLPGTSKDSIQTTRAFTEAYADYPPQLLQALCPMALQRK